MDLKNNFEKKVLKNGLTILFEKREVPVVSIAFAVKAGGVNESLNEKGISHFIEHMLYKGTPTRNSKKIAEEIEKNGGEMNGFTSEEMVGFWCKMPSKKFRIALDVLSDLIKNPLFDEKELEKERQVIFEELRMYKDSPQLHVFDEIHKQLYTGTMGESLIGTYETMNSIDRNKMISKFKEIYTPNNMVLCVVGNTDLDEIVSFIEDYFGNDKSKIKEEEFDLQNKEKIEEREGIDQANLIFAYHVPLAGDKKSYVARILSAITAEGMSSRLFSEIREKRNLAYAVKGDSNINKRFAYNLIYAGTMKQNVEKIKELILTEFEKVSSELIEKELDSVKEQLIGQYKLGMEDSQMQMVNLLASEVHGDAKEFYDFEKNILDVKLDDVKEMASKIKKGNYGFFALVPKD